MGTHFYDGKGRFIGYSTTPEETANDTAEVVSCLGSIIFRFIPFYGFNLGLCGVIVELWSCLFCLYLPYRFWKADMIATAINWFIYAEIIRYIWLFVAPICSGLISSVREYICASLDNKDTSNIPLRKNIIFTLVFLAAFTIFAIIPGIIAWNGKISLASNLAFSILIVAAVVFIILFIGEKCCSTIEFFKKFKAWRNRVKQIKKKG